MVIVAGPVGFEPTILGCLRERRDMSELAPKAHVLVLARLRALIRRLLSQPFYCLGQPTVSTTSLAESGAKS